MSVFIGWSSDDIKRELNDCYKCICSTESCLEDKMSALDVITFAVLAQGVDESVNELAHFLFEDCNKRVQHSYTGVLPSSATLEEYNPNSCKNCGEDEYEGIGSGIDHHIYCINCGQDFDDPSLNWF